MHFSFKQAITAFSLGAMTLTGIAATPALAQPGRDAREYRRDVRDAQQDRRRDVRDARQDYRKDVRDARKDYRRDVKDDRRDWRQDRRANNRPNRVVYNYDYNRPDPRYGRTYQPNRYYRSGYAPVRVDRNTRIYRGGDNRYYCRRSDGTTGLIVGAALGGLLGNQIAQGQSNLLGTLIGGGAGALLGREIDRGGVSCR
jgi:uncharacterized protein YcfJ